MKVSFRLESVDVKYGVSCGLEIWDRKHVEVQLFSNAMRVSIASPHPVIARLILSTTLKPKELGKRCEFQVRSADGYQSYVLRDGDILSVRVVNLEETKLLKQTSHE